MATPSPSRQRPPRPAVPLITLTDGFLVESEGRTVVHVDVASGGIVVHLAGREPLAFGLSTSGLDDASRTVALLVRRAIVRRPLPRAPTTGGLRQCHLFGAGEDVDLADVEGRADEGPGRSERLPSLLKAAILERSQMVARRRDARIDAVAARVAAMTETPLVYSSAVLETPWLIDDVLRFRAAAIAVAMAETLPPPVRADAGVRALIPYLSRWRKLFARDGQVGRAVTKTLALLDTPAFADVDARDVWRLRHVALVQPVRSPRHPHLLSERQRLGGPTLERDLRLLQLVDDDAIDEAIDDVVRALRLQRLAPKQREHVFCEVLGQAERRPGDDRLPAAGAVHTLVRRRLDAVRAARRRVSRGTAMTPVATPPPIPLPIDSRLRFLVTEDDFLAEGERMHHCVGTYFSSAVDGEGYFFHFEDDDGPATVRFGRYGIVEEAKGVCNVKSASARRVAALLSSWGAPLTLLALGDTDAILWHGDGPVLDDGERPLRTLMELARTVALEIEAGNVRDVPVHLDLVRPPSSAPCAVKPGCPSTTPAGSGPTAPMTEGLTQKSALGFCIALNRLGAEPHIKTSEADAFCVSL